MRGARTFGATVLLGGLACLQGCNIARTVDRFIAPDPTIEAKYNLADTATVVFIDDRRNQVNPVRLRRQIADEATAVLIDEGTMQDMISPRDAMAAARRLDTGASPVGIDAIGRAVGASQVIYVEAVAFSLTRDGLTPDPVAVFNVRVWDVDKGVRVFPAESDTFRTGAGFPLQVTIPQGELAGLSGRGATSTLRNMLAKRTGDAIGRMFVTTSYNQGGEQLRRP